MKNTVFQKDLFRWYGEKGESLKEKIFRPIEIKYLCVFRKLQSCKSPLSRIYYKLKLRKLSIKSHIQIPAETKIGEGLYIAHSGRIIINPKSVLGKNINISTGVTIGKENLTLPSRA